MIQQIEAFHAELNPFPLIDVEVLEQRHVHVFNARSAHHVAALVAELSGLRHRIQLLKRRAAHPLVWCMRSVVGIRNQVRTAGIESADFRRAALQRYVCAVVDGKRSAGGQAGDGVELPSVHHQIRGAGRILPTWQSIRSAKDEALRGRLIEKAREQVKKFDWARSAEKLWESMMRCLK